MTFTKKLNPFWPVIDQYSTFFLANKTPANQLSAHLRTLLKT